MGRRNWCSVKFDNSSGDLIWDIRIEIRKGYGQTTGYASSLAVVRVASLTFVP